MYARRLLTLLLAALFMLAGASADAKSKKKKDPTEGLPKSERYGIAVDYRWQPSRTKYASLEGKVYNTSPNDYQAVIVVFILWAKDGDKIQEYRFNTGVLPAGASVKIPLVALGDGDDKPERLQLYGVMAAPPPPEVKPEAVPETKPETVPNSK